MREFKTDRLSRQLYATDASIYQIEPQAVALPHTSEECAEAVRAAAAQGMAVTPRGAGSGLAGGAVGDGLIVDLSPHHRDITEFNRDARTVRVGAGVVLDQLNDFLAPHGLVYGPDVATSSRATLGGMIANNSSGARAPLYGATIDHVESLEIVFSDGRVAEVGLNHDGLAAHAEHLDAVVRAQTAEIEACFHTGICKRWPGYAVDRYLRANHPKHALAMLFGGSEGTLGVITAATLRLVPLPKRKDLALLFFDSVVEAMQATVELLELVPASIEHLDDVVLDQTRGQRAFQAARDLMDLDAQPCASMLMIEFYEDGQDKLAALAKKNLGTRKHLCQNAAEIGHILNLRKAGLSLLTGCKGAAKPTAGIEDVAVPPNTLPDYVAGLQGLMKPLGLKASYYGHAASGLLHVRPVVDLHRGADIAKFRQLAEGVAALTRQFKGSLTAEHGIGIARTEFVEEQIGSDLLNMMGDIKNTLDPDGLFNPGKIFDDGRYKIDTHLRMGDGYELRLPTAPVLAFAEKDESFVDNLEQCNGCGGCRKDPPTMCPTFRATGDEVESTRGRANIIRAVLDGRLGELRQALHSDEIDAALGHCLSCKACTSECPSNVNMALLKAEMLHARHQLRGTPLSARVLSRVDLLGKLASTLPRVTNATLAMPWFRLLLEKTLGLSRKRPLPAYAARPFHHVPQAEPQRGTVLLWDDCFVRHNEPHIGDAAVRVLEKAGYRVELLKDRACCGRPAFSMGRLELARNFGEKNLARLKDRSEALIFLEPSCYSMFKQDYQELGLPGAQDMAARSFLFEDFILDLLDTAPDALPFDNAPRSTAVHVHCHAKALSDPQKRLRLAQAIPGNTARLLDTGCCGMAGAFGAMADKYELSTQVAQELVEQIDALPPDTQIIASGTSCRHQITHLTPHNPLHMAQLLDQALR
jgi:FAD/FMN-containing dehydrogenase/Fe-S oxidoreductase